jgi:hypothetical protein
MESFDPKDMLGHQIISISLPKWTKEEAKDLLKLKVL